MTLAGLLEVQGHDTQIDQLRYRRANLVEIAALAMIEEEQKFVSDLRATIESRLNESGEERSDLEGSLAKLVDRRRLQKERMMSGEVRSHKDLLALQAAVDALTDRIDPLESQILELLEAVDEVEAELVSVEQSEAEILTRKAAAEAALCESEATLDTQLESERSARAVKVTELPPLLVEAYETARRNCGGVGVAELVDKTCEGCRLRLSAVAYDAVRKSARDELVYCDCGRILVFPQ